MNKFLHFTFYKWQTYHGRIIKQHWMLSHVLCHNWKFSYLKGSAHLWMHQLCRHYHCRWLVVKLISLAISFSRCVHCRSSVSKLWIDSSRIEKSFVLLSIMWQEIPNAPPKCYYINTEILNFFRTTFCPPNSLGEGTRKRSSLSKESDGKPTPLRNKVRRVTESFEQSDSDNHRNNENHWKPG